MLPASKGKNKMRYLSTLIGDEAGTSSEQHLAEELPTFLHALDRFRRERRVGLRLLHRIEEALRAGGVASTRDQADEEGAVALGPTSTSMAALIIKLLETDERHSSSLSRTAHLDGNLSRLAAAIRKLSANDLAALFELLDADGLLKQSSSPRIIKEYQGKIEGVREQKRLQEEVDGAVRGSQEASRLDLVQKQLLRQEEFEGAKKGLETWLVQTIRWVRTSSKKITPITDVRCLQQRFFETVDTAAALLQPDLQCDETSRLSYRPQSSSPSSCRSNGSQLVPRPIVDRGRGFHERAARATCAA